MSGVQVRGSIKARPDGKFDDRLAATIGERLIALEKANRGTAAGFVAPELPSFGPGSPGGGPGAPGPPGPAGAPGVTDHGALTGLEDDDHPQYVLHGQETVAHVHTDAELVGLENRFVQRGETIRAAAHSHAAQDVVGVDTEFVRRGESVRPAAHQHVLSDVADYSLWELMLWQRILGE
ncbi:MAG: hypothetical protein ACM369_08720 [Acidobacteriota bacterium]